MAGEPVVDEVHIASFVVQHRDDAVDAMSVVIREHDDLELVRREGSRSIVLCECEESQRVIEHIERMRAIPGVITVSLVYHHAESRAALDAPLVDAAKAGGRR